MTVPAGDLGSREDGWVARAVAPFTGRRAGVVVGPGHDCAVLDVEGARVVVTTDVLVDGVHFEGRACGAAVAAGKALRVNLSDLAAAGAVPVAFEIGVVLPPAAAADPAFVDAVAGGLALVAERYACPCVGGDTNVAEAPLTLAVTAIGRAGPSGRILDRSGACVGDVLSVTGPLGGSLRGRHLDFEPRLLEGRTLAGLDAVHAMMDVSDGLSVDLPRLCRASGVGARLDAGQVPVHPDVGPGSKLERLGHALDDGEDFELLVAHAELDADALATLQASSTSLRSVGRVVPAEQGVRLVLEGREADLVPRGYDHFARGPERA